MEKGQYEKDLKLRQEEHLKKIRENKDVWKPCKHDACPECIGTRINKDGYHCMHYINCHCPKCSPKIKC